MKWFVVSAIGIIIAFALGFQSVKTSSPHIEPMRETASVAASNDAPNLPHRDGVWYPVVKVVDGDTLTVTMGGKNTTIRLIGLDTPETVDPRKPVQCFGREASEKAKKILSGTSVRIETDPSQGEFDKYGRTLAYVFLPDGTNFNQLMIEEGYGHEYTYNLPYKYQAQFKAAEEQAREQKEGLWADDACSGTRTSDVPVPPPTFGNTYECSKNTYNCSDFSTQMQAQSVFDSCGGSGNDIHKLDADGDGRVCESLP